MKKKYFKLESEEELLSVVNFFCKVYFKEESPFTLSELLYYCNPNNIDNRYTFFDLPKKSRKSVRHIAIPCLRLKRLQSILYYILQAAYKKKYNKAATGFILGRSIVTNAEKHKRKKYVYNLDLKDFFSSIEMFQVWAVLQSEPFNFSDRIASLLSGLCCMRVEYKQDNALLYKYVLPQGAPSSPILSNIVCAKLDGSLNQLARNFGLRYSRYADDITFSGNDHVFHDNDFFILKLRSLIEEQNFKINEKKVRLQHKGQRQTVTGLVVNNGVTVGRNFVRELRSLLYIWEKYGYEAASNKFITHYMENNSHICVNIPLLENSIKGKLNYIKMVRGDKNKAYIKMKKRFDKLMEVKPKEVKE